MLRWSHKRKIVKISNKDLTSYNKRNKKLSLNLNNFPMVFYFNKKYNLITLSPISIISSKPKTIKRNSIKTEQFLINQEIKMDQNNFQFIQDHIKKLLKYLSLQDQNQSTPDFKIMQASITKTLQWKVSTSFLKSNNKK